jgi:nitroreductase
MDFVTVIRSRFSARKFLDRQVPEQTLQRILELAQHTASWCNCQPWQLVITRGAATERFRQAVYAHARSGARPNPDFPFPAAYEGVYRDRRKVCGVQLYQALDIGKDDRESAAQQALENFRLFGAPHVAIVTTEEKLGVYGAIDCGLYVGNFLLAARNEGVDTIAQAALASYPDFVREFFALSGNRKVVCGISFGFADQRDPIHAYRTERAAVAEAVKFVET